MHARRWDGLGRRTLAVACGVASLLASHAAMAKPLHHHHVYSHQAVQPTPQNTSIENLTALGPTAPGVSSIVIDASSGKVVSEAGADIPRFPASLTKLMTLDLAFQALRAGRMTLDTQLPVSVHASSVEPVKLGLMPGDVITVRQAILAMTTMSANDAATVLGEYLGGGSEYRCAQMMTLRAHSLGMAQTQFYNASGLPNPGQVTTARDLSILARDIVVSYPQYQPFFETVSFDFNGRTVYSNNAMLKIYPGAMGMKTGYTILARHNLITAAQRNGVILIGVALHEPSWGQTYTQMTALLDTGFGYHVPGVNTPGNAAVLLAARQAPPASAAAPAANKQVASQNLRPPVVPLPAPKSGIASLIPTADAATIRPVVPKQLAQNSHVTSASVAGWTAQVGSFSKMKSARQRAINVHQMQGVGIARVARLDRGGKVLWAAQLAGLTQYSAHATCHALAAQGSSCVVIAPQGTHLAMRDTSAG